MGLFKKKEVKSYLGIDLGGSLIKLVQLENVNNKAKLVTFGYAEKPIYDVSTDFLDYPDKIAEILVDLCKQAGTTTNKVITALPASSVFSSIINLPDIKKQDINNKEKMEESVRYEAKKVIPLPLEEMIIDWKYLPRENNNDTVQVLLTGAAKKLVKKYVDIFRRAQLELVSLETESFGLTRSLIGNDKSVIMIVDIGATSTYILIVDNGIPFLDRTINVAGMNISKVIADTLDIPVEFADQFKADYSNSNFAKDKKLPEVIEEAFSSIIHEINYCFNLYKQDEYGGQKIEKIILSGGTSGLPNIIDYLSKLLNIPVFIGDPWARVIYPKEMKPLLNEIGSRFAVSIGLAMRDID